MKINIILSKKQKLPQNFVEIFEKDLNYRIKTAFPSSQVTVKKGSCTGVEIVGFPSDSDREHLDVTLQEGREGESCR